MRGIHKDYCQPSWFAKLVLALRGPACRAINATLLTERERQLPRNHKFVENTHVN